METITIKDFKGINLKEGLWKKGFSLYTYGMDIYGLDRDFSRISYPGVLQSAIPLSAGAQATGVSAVTELQCGFTTFQSVDYSIGTGNPGRLYRRVGTTWTFMTTSALGSCSINAGGLEVYGSKMYIAQVSQWGTWDGAIFTAGVNSFTDTTSSPRLMKVFAGSLYTTDNRYISKWDGTTWTPTALTLPSDFTTHSMEVYGNYLYITATNGIITKLILWDGISPTFNSFIDLLDEPTGAKLKLAGGVLWVIPNRTTGSGVPLYVFDGAQLQKVQTVPVAITVIGGAADYAGGLAFASDNAGATGYEDGVGGVWMMNRLNANEPFYATIPFIARQLTQVQFGAIAPSLKYVSVSDILNGTYEIFELQGSASNATSVWVSLPIDAGSTSDKSWTNLKANFDALPTGTTAVFKYRLNDTTTWTTLKTFNLNSAATDRNMLIPLGRTSRTITLRVDLTGSANLNSTRLHSISLSYEPTGD